MRYKIEGDTLPVVICQLEAGEKMITERGFYGMDVPEYEDGDRKQRRHWKDVWPYVFRRSVVPEYLYSPGRTGTDCFCIQLSRGDKSL